MLQFFLARLKFQGGRPKGTDLYLRFKPEDNGSASVSFAEQLLSAFCFPLGPETVQPKEVLASEEYTFSLQHSDGQRYYGFCRQFLPPAPRVGSKLRYPQVLCVIVAFPWCTLFFKVLQVVEQLMKAPDSSIDPSSHDLSPDTPLWAMLSDLSQQLSTAPLPGGAIRSDDRIVLQVPPDCGNGRSNSGIALARLLWHVPPEAMLTLVAAMLLERRIVFVSQSRDTVSAAVLAAQALLYPFKWHHILLPTLPKSLMDYLTAPMPFMVGLPADMMIHMRGIPMNEITMIDLDLKTCKQEPGPDGDDGQRLPYREHLLAALRAVAQTLRSPTEYESTPLITGVMQEYFLRLIGSYRRYVSEEPPPGLPTPRPASQGGRSGASTPHSRGLHNVSSAGRLYDDTMRGSGYCFDHVGFVQHRRNDKVRAFLGKMRQSQLYEVFVQERLALASQGYGYNDAEDAFEACVTRYVEQRAARRERLRAMSMQDPGAAHNHHVGGGGGGPGSRLAAKLRRHRRTDSEDMAVMASAVSVGSVASSKQLDSMRRIGTVPALQDAPASTSDPTSFFQMIDDDGDELDSPAAGHRLGYRHSGSGSSLADTNGDAPSPTHPSSSGRGRENRPLGRASAPLVAKAAAAVDRLLLHASSQEGLVMHASDSGGLGEVGVDPAVLEGRRSHAYSMLGSQGSGQLPEDAAGLASLEIKDGVQVRTDLRGHRVYDGRVKDMLHMVVSDVKNVFATLASPRLSPRGSQPGAPPPANISQQQAHQPSHGHSLSLSHCSAHQPPTLQSYGSGSMPLPSMPTPTANGAAAAGTPQLGGGGGGLSGMLAGLKDKVGGAAARAGSSVSFYKPPSVAGGGNGSVFGYKPQTTGGEKSAKFKERLVSGVGCSLVAGADGKLKQPHAPQRPLGFGAGAGYASSPTFGGLIRSSSSASLHSMPSMTTLNGDRPSTAGERLSGAGSAISAVSANSTASAPLPTAAPPPTPMPVPTGSWPAAMTTWDPFSVGPGATAATAAPVVPSAVSAGAAGPSGSAAAIATASAAAAAFGHSTTEVSAAFPERATSQPLLPSSGSAEVAPSRVLQKADSDREYCAFAGATSPTAFTAMFASVNMCSASVDGR